MYENQNYYLGKGDKWKSFEDQLADEAERRAKDFVPSTTTDSHIEPPGIFYLIYIFLL